jgi:hypothetical protein
MKKLTQKIIVISESDRFNEENRMASTIENDCGGSRMAQRETGAMKT